VTGLASLQACQAAARGAGGAGGQPAARPAQRPHLSCPVTRSTSVRSSTPFTRPTCVVRTEGKRVCVQRGGGLEGPTGSAPAERLERAQRAWRDAPPSPPPAAAAPAGRAPPPPPPRRCPPARSAASPAAARSRGWRPRPAGGCQGRGSAVGVGQHPAIGSPSLQHPASCPRPPPLAHLRRQHLEGGVGGEGEEAHGAVVHAHRQEGAARAPLGHGGHVQAGHVPAQLPLLALHQHALHAHGGGRVCVCPRRLQQQAQNRARGHGVQATAACLRPLLRPRCPPPPPSHTQHPLTPIHPPAG
jgi:hypothetical protein